MQSKINIKGDQAMKTYIVFVYKKFISGQENSIYKVSAASEESAVAKAKGRIFSEKDASELVEVAITDVCRG